MMPTRSKKEKKEGRKEGKKKRKRNYAIGDIK
jgi:hypothetical protein